MMMYFYVFIGGGLGSICRFLLAQWLPIKAGQIPWATFWANFLSCIIIGLMVSIMEKSTISDQTKWLVIVGFCGGFSTFSTFSIESYQLFQTGYSGVAIIYITINILLCLVGIFLGIKVMTVF